MKIGPCAYVQQGTTQGAFLFHFCALNKSQPQIAGSQGL